MKNNNKGFTLIELLAVIVIMGILMMVAIPAMSKVIENSRKDTFVETAQTYANEVSTLWYADGLQCQTTKEDGESAPGAADNSAQVASALGEGDYYVAINTKAIGAAKLPALIERGGKSSWGNDDVYGFVHVNVSGESNKAKFYVALSDGIHYIDEKTDGTLVDAEDLKRVNVKLSGGDAIKALVGDDKNVTTDGKKLNLCWEK